MKRGFVAAALVLCLTSAAARYGAWAPGPGAVIRMKYANAESYGHGFNFCRAAYTSGRREAGGQGWSTDYPDAELNFSIRLSELTKTRVSKDSNGRPEHLVVRLTEDFLYQCPYLHMEDVGTASLTDAEVQGLRAFLLKGGFLWVDDYWASYALQNWQSQLARVLPRMPGQDISLDHPIFKSMFK